MTENKYYLKVKETYWPSLTEEQLRARITALLAIGANMIDTGWAEKQPEPPVRIVEKQVIQDRYHCSVKGCNYIAWSKSALGGHTRGHALIPLKVTR